MSKLRFGLATGLSLSCVIAFGAAAQGDPIHKIPHQKTPSFRMQSPLSTSVLIAHAVRAGILKPSALSRANIARRSHLPSSALPNVQASGGNGGSVANETPIIVNPTDSKSLLAGANDYNCSSVQGFYFSSDAGATWTPTCLPLSSDPSVIGGYGDPGVAYDSNGTAYASGIDELNTAAQDGAIVVSRWDPAAGWSSPIIAARKADVFMDKPWMEIDTNGTSPHKDAIYVSMTEFGDLSPFPSSIGVSHSTDGGQHWTLKTVNKVKFPEVNQFSDLAVGADGTVYVSWMRCTANGPTGDCGGTVSSIWTSKSLDGGNTWSKAVMVHKAHLAFDWCNCAYYGNLANTNERLNNIPVIAIDNSGGGNNGHLYIADTYYDTVYHVMRVQVATSTDGGFTWSSPVRVSSKADKAYNDQVFPWMNVSPTGLVGVSWLDRRLDPANINYDAFGTTSADASTFALNTRLSDTSSNPFADGFGGYFIGDYTGNAWAKKSKTTPLTLFATWTDTRSGEDQDEVGGLLP